LGLYAREVGKGNRFEFGENWKQLLKADNEQQILRAKEFLKQLLVVKSFSG